jgi:hypothetical protein
MSYAHLAEINLGTYHMLTSRCSLQKGRLAPSRTAYGAIEKWQPFLKVLAALRQRSILLLAIVASTGCHTRTSSVASKSLTPAGAAAVEQDVRAFAQTVAHDVAVEGPLAWLKYFDAGPSFFMAVNGQMAFPNRAAANEGTKDFALTIRHIELEWGDLRVDPLTPEFAVVAAPWREIQVDNGGHRVEEDGFFTALAEYRDGRWQFRDAHWSSPVSPSPAQ